jgi:hypothetical protein
MKIYYSPAFTSHAYYNLKEEGIAFDTAVCGNADLLRILMLHLGIHHDFISQVERQAEYYNTFVDCDKNDTNNIFHQSFKVGGLAVSSKCLEWRDKLILAGWTPHMQESPRLQFLSVVEKEFHCIGEADCWIEVLEALNEQCALPEGSEVILSDIPRKYLPPYISDVFTKLENHGITIKENHTGSAYAKGNLATIQKYLLGADVADTLEAGDKSFEILRFTDEMTALQYAASLKPDSYDVYINSDNKAFDDIQLALNYPTSGSAITNANPQIVQIFTLGLSLFDYPINIHNVLSWLLVPMSPIHSTLRRKLAYTIANSGGIKNEEWEKTVAEYKEKDIYDYSDNGKALRSTDDKQSDINALSTYLPFQDKAEIKTQVLRKFVEDMKNYAQKMSHINDNKPIISTFAIEQFDRLVSMFNALTLILGKYRADTLSYSDLELWTNAIYESGSFAYTETLSGSRFVVGSPGDISTPTDSILWMDFYNYSTSKPTYDFLSKEERDALTAHHCLLTDSDAETSLANSYYKLPFLYSRSRLTLITIDQKNGVLTTKHPMLIRLEQDFKDSLPKVTSAGKLSDEYYKEKNLFTNAGDGLQVTIENKDLLSFREMESFSSLESLIQNPFDYTMQHLANFKNGNTFQLGDLKNREGIVAHAIIERLCKDNERDIDKIQAYIKDHFDELLEQTILAKGAILLLTENKTEKMLFAQQLKEAVDVLLEIIRENHLTIVGNEVELKDKLPDFYKDICAQGILDMVLTDESGSPILFDFKWSNNSRYQQSLRENTSLQLALYEQLLEKECKKQVATKAYFLFPLHELLTTSTALHGRHVHRINSDNAVALLPQIRASYEYRRRQIEDQGFIELAEGTPAADILYYKEQEDKNLFPLVTYNKGTVKNEIVEKGKNNYSNYTLLKGIKK